MRRTAPGTRCVHHRGDTGRFHGPPRPGFRVTPDELDDRTFLHAVMQVANDLTDAALAARRELLHLGAADDHHLCRVLDRTASEYATVFAVASRQWAAALIVDVDTKGRT